MRTNMPSFGKHIPLTCEHFAEFEQCYGDHPNGQSPRQDLGKEVRFRCFTWEQIRTEQEREQP